MKITVFCRRKMRVAHFHPVLEQAPCAEGRPWLGKQHEHSIEITITATCKTLTRDVELLNLQNTLDGIVARGVIDMGPASFESMCVRFAGLMHDDRVSAVRIEADGGVEGAEVFFTEST